MRPEVLRRPGLDRMTIRCSPDRSAAAGEINFSGYFGRIESAGRPDFRLILRSCRELRSQPGCDKHSARSLQSMRSEEPTWHVRPPLGLALNSCLDPANASDPLCRADSPVRSPAAFLQNPQTVQVFSHVARSTQRSDHAHVASPVSGHHRSAHAASGRVSISRWLSALARGPNGSPRGRRARWSCGQRIGSPGPGSPDAFAGGGPDGRMVGRELSPVRPGEFRHRKPYDDSLVGRIRWVDPRVLPEDPRPPCASALARDLQPAAPAHDVRTTRASPPAWTGCVYRAAAVPSRSRRCT